MLEIMQDIEARETIAATLLPRSQDERDEYWEEAQITLRVGGATSTVSSYDLEVARVIAAFQICGDRDQWDGGDDSVVIFELAGGFYGCAVEHYWWGPTFSGRKYSLEISESTDWDLFYRFVLTDESREILSAFLTPVIGLTSTNPDVRKIAQELYHRP